MKVAQLGEESIITALSSLGCAATPPDITGMGDDCAIFTDGEGRATLVTTDLLVEGVHFRRDWTTPRDLGHKSLAVNLSDIAAMGGTPHSAYLSLALPADLERAWLDDFSSGLDALATTSGCLLLGGDTTRSPGPVVINLAVLGHAAPEQIKRRNRAKAGDQVCVTGTLGNAAAGLRLLQQGLLQDPPTEDEAHLLASLHHPRPHLTEGRLLAAHPGVHAMMDLSDGLATDLRRMMGASGCGARVALEDLPMSPTLRRVAEAQGWDAEQTAAAGGEEYCLLLTALPEAVEYLPVQAVGEVVEGEGVVYTRGGEPEEDCAVLGHPAPQ